MAETLAPTGAEMNERARQRNAGRYLLNTLRNLPHLVSGVDPDRLRGQFAGVPAIVVGAGPSLDQNMAALQVLGNRGLIIAADTAWRPLATAGIDPHLVVALDPTETNGRHLTDVPFERAPWLFAEGSVDPDALATLAGRIGVFRVGVHHPWPWLQGLGIERPLVRVWGSVLTACYELALTFGCDPIIFAGSDLAFTNYQPYCRQTTFESDWAEHTARGVSLAKVWKNTLTARQILSETGLNGERALTSPHLVEFRNWIVARSTEASDRRTVNATGAGILQGPHIEQSNLVSELEPLADRDGDLRDLLNDRLSGGLERERAGRVLDAIEMLSRGTDSSGHRAGSSIADWLAFGGSSLTTSQIAAATGLGRGGLMGWPTGVLAPPVDGFEPAAAFLASDLDVLAPIVLSDRGLPASWVCATLDDERAMVTPREGAESFHVAADGSFAVGEPWGIEISGEVPWGRSGGAIAWNRSTNTILLRHEAGSAPIVETVPFAPSRVALLAGGVPIWHAFDGGLWEWLPGKPGRFLIDTPQCGSLFVDGGDVVLAPITRDDNGTLVRRRLHYEWRYNLASRSLTRVETGHEGQCINVAPGGDWTARAFSYSDLVRLDHRDGRSILLSCRAPFGVAWAGPSLLVTAGPGTVLLFRDLVSHLDRWHTHCSFPVQARV